VVGEFAAMSPGDTAASYSARIDWGDGNASPATLTANPDGTFSVLGSNTYAGAGVYTVRVLITRLSDGQTIALNAAVSVNSSTYTGPAFPSPAFPGQGGTGAAGNGGSGTATTTGQGAHHKKHPKHPVKAQHALHAAGKNILTRPLQGLLGHRAHRPH
jgi:hypothetical protein